mgnify:CR=1 FL=1
MCLSFDTSPYSEVVKPVNNYNYGTEKEAI